ncbi:NACHT domain-containing protein [Streptomyces olivochromogenes]|uniref:NACHT domain-containing protein n=1 Tax=Streptomyces olivochromogenes TaxID=1963 RepID=UPI0036A5A816
MIFRNFNNKPWLRLRSNSSRTTFGDVDISGYFAAGRDIKVRNFTITQAVLGRQEERIRKRMLAKVLPAWLNEGEYWQGGDEMEFPVSAEFSITHVNHPRPDLIPIDDRSMVKRWTGIDTQEALNASSGKLLILGEAGSGKTRSLHKIMRLAIDLARQEDQNPIPFYLHLSEWSGKHKDMRLWFAHSIRENYGVLPGIFAQWLASSDVMLILDGLDDLRLRERRECIAALNHFISGHAAVQVVVACRLNEYRDTGRKLNLNASLLIEGVDGKRVFEVITQHGGKLAELERTVKNDRKLRELLHNPLFLRLAIALYSDGDAIAISKSKDRRTGLLAAYIQYAERKMARNGIESGRWLPFIARALKEQRRIMFCPDRYSVEFLPIQFKELAERRTLLMSSLLVGIPTLILRGALVLLAPESPTKSVYISITLLAPVSYGYLAWRVIKGDLWGPLAGRRTSVVQGLLRFARRVVLVCVMEAGAAWSLVSSGAADGLLGGISLLLMVTLTMWPALQMTRESDTSDPSEIPDRVGGEMLSLVRATVIVAALVAAAMYVTLTIVFTAFESVPAVGQGLLFSPLLNAFFFIVPVAFIAALRNGGVDLIRRDQCRRIMVRFGYLPRDQRTALEEIRKASLVIPRRGALEFRHALIRDHLADQISDAEVPSSFVAIRSNSAS